MSRISDNPIDRQLGQNIRNWRKGKGWSQGALGATVGIAFQQIQKYENAANRVSVSRLYEIAEALEVPIGELLAGVGPKDRIAPINPQAMIAASMLQNMHPDFVTFAMVTISELAVLHAKLANPDLSKFPPTDRGDPSTSVESAKPPKVEP